jgi:hypothetical protein
VSVPLHEVDPHIGLAMDLAYADEASWVLLDWEGRARYRRLAIAAMEALGQDPRRHLAPVADTWREHERRLFRQRLGKAHAEAQAQERRLGKLLKRFAEEAKA